MENHREPFMAPTASFSWIAVLTFGTCAVAKLVGLFCLRCSTVPSTKGGWFPLQVSGYSNLGLGTSINPL